MKKTLFQRFILVVLVVAAFSQSCTKLDETLYSSVTPSNFFKTQEEFVSALGAAYTQLSGYASGDVNNLQELSSDEEVVPTRGQDWDDGGNWRRLHLHSWKYEDNATSNAWGWLFSGVNTANRLIYQVSNLATAGQVTQDVANANIAELSALRGFFYWHLIDLYGNVPLVTSFENSPAAPATVDRKTVYNFLAGNLKASTPLLSKTVGGAEYGKMNYYAAWTLLAKLYLNKGVYTGTTAWDSVIMACDTVINSGKFSLEADYFTNFNVQNNVSKEFIFAIPYDKIFFQGFNLNAQTLHYASQFTYNLTFQPWNGFCSVEEFYNSYDSTDLRKGDPGTLQGPAKKRGNFLAGYQYNYGGGAFVPGAPQGGGGICWDAGYEKGQDPDSGLLNFGNIGHPGVPQINMLGSQAWRQSGVRIGKWQFEIGGTNNMSNDFAIFRYADVLLMKAEALWRLNPADVDALALVNMVRERAGVPDLPNLDGPLSFDIAGGSVPGGELFNEIGREMFAELNRRQELIRWEFFEDNAKWTIVSHVTGDATFHDTYLRLFPVGKSVLAANPNLVQNPGY